MMSYNTPMAIAMQIRLISGLLACLVSSTIFSQTDWTQFTDASATNIVSDAGDQVGMVDFEEKDLAVGDLDRDGDPDLIIVRKRPFSTPGGRRNVLFMNNGGVMTDMSDSLAPGFLDITDDRDVVIADINGDSWLDVITATTFSDPPRIYLNLGNDAGNNWLGLEYDPADNRVPTFTPGPKFCAVAAGDLTGTNGADLYFVDYDNTLEDRLLINNGNAFFTDETTGRMRFEQFESVFGTSALIADFNLDGSNDIVKVSASGSMPPDDGSPPQVRLIYNNGTGNFIDMDIIYDGAPYMAAIIDYNNDNRPDLYIVDDGQDFMLINTSTVDGQAIFQSQELTQSPFTAGFGGNIAIGDMDGDGFDDVYVTDVDTDIPGCDRFPVALQHNGDVFNPDLIDRFNGAGRGWLPAGTFDAVIADFNMDGDNDLWLGTCTGNRLLFGGLEEEFMNDGFENPVIRRQPVSDRRSG